MDVELIRGLPLFASLPPDEIERLPGVLSPLTFAPGTLLFLEDEANGSLYLLLEGDVEIIKALGSDGERLLGIRGPGSFIGEMSVFSPDGRHTATVRARTPLRVLAMERGDFTDLLARQPGLADEMMRILSQRLDESENLTIRDLLEKNRELRQAYDELKAAQVQLIEKERLEAELAVARSIQFGLLPHAPPRLPGLDFGMIVEPMHTVGGDLFDFVPLGRDRLGIAVGDVSGHGVPAAIFMALTYSLLRAEAARGGAPGRVLARVNRHLLGMGDSGMFVTLLYGVLDGATHGFTYARAGHPEPLLLGVHGAAAGPALRTGQPLGLFDASPIDEQHVALPPGGMLLLYTDGVTEAMDAQGEPFGLQRLREVLAGARCASAQDACQAVLDAVHTHCAAAALHDDVLLVAVGDRTP